MNKLPVITRRVNEQGFVEYRVAVVSDWDGFDSLVSYLQKHWQGQISESLDNIYSRRWVVRVEGTPVSICHDSQIGNYFLCEDDAADQAVLEKIAADLAARLDQA